MTTNLIQRPVHLETNCRFSKVFTGTETSSLTSQCVCVCVCVVAVKNVFTKSSHHNKHTTSQKFGIYVSHLIFDLHCKQ